MRDENTRGLTGMAAGLALWAGPGIVAVTTIGVLVSVGAHLFAALALALVLSTLAAAAITWLLPLLRD